MLKARGILQYAFLISSWIWPTFQRNTHSNWSHYSITAIGNEKAQYSPALKLKTQHLKCACHTLFSSMNEPHYSLNIFITHHQRIQSTDYPLISTKATPITGNGNNEKDLLPNHDHSLEKGHLTVKRRRRRDLFLHVQTKQVILKGK